MTAADLVYLFQEASNARSEEQRARESYEGGSWGYHGYSLIYSAQKAEERLQDALERFIDKRIALKLEERKP